MTSRFTDHHSHRAAVVRAARCVGIPKGALAVIDMARALERRSAPR